MSGWPLAALLLLACRERGDAGTSPATGAPPACFVDVTSGSGVDFRHRHGGAGEKQLPELSGGAVAVLDFDGDGKLDLYFPQGGPMPKSDPSGVDYRDRMFRGLGGGRFEDVTDAVGCSEPGYSFGAAAADYDGDGDPDLFVCNYGGNRLLRNDRAGDGSVRFTDVTDAAAAGDRAWSSCAAFADFDRDGDLDLYVGNYVIYDEQHPIYCGDKARGPEWRSYCHPDEFRGAPDQLLRNNGDGTFTDVTAAAGLEHADGKCLGLLVLDADGDGDVDVLVANDSTPNFLWRNDSARSQLRFTDVADEAGVAVSANGLSQACMGVDGADVDLDGDFDVVLTNLDMQYNTLYRNDGGGFFSDRSLEYGMEPSIPFVGFGARFLDVDRDGDEDLVVVNGHVIDNIQLYKPSQSFAQPSHLYWNDGRGRFRLAGDEAGDWFRERHVGRALASLDWDDDGDLDLVAVENDGRAALLENRREPHGHWIGFRLHGRDANRDAIGALVTVTTADRGATKGRVQRREQRGTCSYNAFVDLRLLFGLGEAATVAAVEVRWPRGAITRIDSPAVDRYIELKE